MNALILLLSLCFLAGCIEWGSRITEERKKKSLTQDKTSSTVIQAGTTIPDGNALIGTYRYYAVSDTQTGELAQLIENLRKMDKTNPKQREQNELDKWFVEHVECFYRYAETMTFIQHFGYLCEVFLNNLKQPEQNLELQKRLVSIDELGFLNFQNVFVCYLDKWDLLPEVKQLIFSDKRFRWVRRVYINARKLEMC